MDASELWIAILESSRDGDRKRVAELPDLGAEPDLPDIFLGYTPLHNAIAARGPDLVTLLLDHGAGIEHCNNTVGQSLLLTAVLVGSQQIAQLLRGPRAFQKLQLLSIADGRLTSTWPFESSSLHR